MAILATDDFNRANANPIGGNWTTTTGQSAMQISTNAVAPSSVSLDCAAFYNAVTWPNDQYAQVKVTVTGTTLDTGIGPMVRCASAAQTFYRVVANSNGTNNLTLDKAVASTFTTLWTRTATVNAGDTLRLEAQGTTLRVYVNGVQVGTDTTDSSIASGNAGVGYSSASTSASADDFEGGDFTGGSIPWTAPRFPSYRDPGETWWIQKDRRDANTVGTAANPLPAPLDSAWQAGGRYWHSYNDLAYRFTFVPYAQRDRRDANTVGSAPPAAVLPSATRTVPVRDPGEVPWQQAPRRDPALLTTALLENELLGSADDLRRRYNQAAFYDRREVPQQRTYFDTTLLATALLENELLGSADDLRRRYGQAAYYDRREVPQQRAYVSDPALLLTALLENELLGSADDLRRRYNQAAFYDRREVPQQRSVQAQPDPVPADPTLAGWWPDWLAENRAATHVDRREVPQQRLYISDPSFYPSVAPTDPLTVAWGAGGTYWLLYNTAALQVSRREYPQQRAYVSDPALLLTALLENELLGSADDLRRHYLQTVFYDRRLMPQQRTTPAPADVPADPLLLLDNLRRAYLTAAYYDRREVPQQRKRETLFFDAGPDVPPLTLSWGGGGVLWHLYNRPSRPRPFWPQRAAAGVVECVCQTRRPFTGTTSRPGTGTTSRPFAGVTSPPCVCG